MPGHLAFGQKFQLLTLSPCFGDPMVAEARGGAPFPDGKGYADANLYAKDIVSRAR